MIEVYIAGRWEDRERIIDIKAALETNKDIRVISSWLTPSDNITMAELHHQPTRAAGLALKDVEEVGRAHVFVAFNPKDAHRSGTGGRHTEFGMALAMAKRIVYVGDRENLFHFLPAVRILQPGERLAAVIREEYRAWEQEMAGVPF